MPRTDNRVMLNCDKEISKKLARIKGWYRGNYSQKALEILKAAIDLANTPPKTKIFELRLKALQAVTQKKAPDVSDDEDEVQFA